MSAEFKPTTNVQVEPETIDLTASIEEEEVPATPIKPHRQPATCCPIKAEVCTQTEPVADGPYNPLLLLQALGVAFAAGALIGVGVSYAFSRPSVVEYISE